MLYISEQDFFCDLFKDWFVGAIVECEYVDGKITSGRILFDETKQREEKMKSKLKNLFSKRNS